MADRCSQAGISSCISATDAAEVERSERKKAFYHALKAGGLRLEEPEPIEHSHENDPNFTWKRFTIKHTREDKLDENPVIRK